MLLSGEEIREAVADGELVIEPFDNDSVQPACIDLKLYSLIRVQSNEPIKGIVLDPDTLNVQELLGRYSEEMDISENRSYEFGPGEFVIGGNRRIRWLAQRFGGQG